MPATRSDTTFSLTYEVSASIAAPPAAAFALLTDAARFPEWNSTVTSIEGRIALGEKHAIKVPLAPGRTFRPTVVEFVPDTRMVWADGMAPFFAGRRTFTLTPTADGCVFTMSETFRGLSIPLARGSLPDFREAFDRYAADLARAAAGKTAPKS